MLPTASICKSCMVPSVIGFLEIHKLRKETLFKHRASNYELLLVKLSYYMYYKILRVFLYFRFYGQKKSFLFISFLWC